MTRNVIDNAILLSAMTGYDSNDAASKKDYPRIASAPIDPAKFDEMRLGVFASLMESDSIYKNTVEGLKAKGAKIIEFTPPTVQMDGFLSILNIDMKNDFSDAVAFNNLDSLVRIPYGQGLFNGILEDSTTTKGLEKIKATLEKNGRTFFDKALDEHHLDAILSINNYHAGYAAVAKYPALTIPMGYKTTGEPISLTFIGKQFQEANLLMLGATYEKAFPNRKAPENYN